MTDAVARGTGPLRAQLDGVTRALEELTEAVNQLRLGHEALARGHERVILSMALMRSDNVKAFEILESKMDLLRASPGGGTATPSALSIIEKIMEIKCLVRGHQVERTGKTTRSGDVCLSAARRLKEYVSVTAGFLGVDEAEASDWLQSYVDMPTRKDPSVVKRIRRSAPIARVKAHCIYQWKDIVIAAYFAAIGLPRDAVAAQQALQLLSDMAYLLSVRGFPAMLCALEALLLHQGAGFRIVEPISAGDRKVIHSTLGHVALVTSFVRYVLEVIAGLRPAHGGVGEGIFDVWGLELPRVDGVLPHDDEEHAGLRLVDGTDPCRGQVPEDGEEGPADLGEPAGDGSGDADV